jgi:hypothetical protein
MPKMVGFRPERLLLITLVLIVAFGFTPISRSLLKSVDGSFEPSAYSSLALSSPSDATGILAGESVRVQLVNHSGHVKTYRWAATQKGSLLSLGAETLDNGRTKTFSVPSRGAESGTLKIALVGSNIYVTVPVLKL